MQTLDTIASHCADHGERAQNTAVGVSLNRPGGRNAALRQLAGDRLRVLPWLLLVLLWTGSHTVGAQARDYSETRVPCANFNPLNNLHWGDLHVHTRFSLDASTQGTRTTPAQAYAFARGESIGIQPWLDGQPQRQMQLSRPLDFAAVTDHAELLGEVQICNTPGMAGHDGWACRVYRGFPRVAFFLITGMANKGKHPEFCGDQGELCLDAARGPWQLMQEAAEEAYDRSAQCEFTTFIGYEWTGASDNLANTHRNVIFRNSDVPALPISFIDSRKLEVNLYEQLDDACIEADGRCDVIVIPHNSNLSDGAMFRQTRADGSPIREDDARTRARFETLVELMQHKGSSECYYGPGNMEDELCAFEQLPYDKFSGKFYGWTREAPAEDDGFMRQVLRQGLVEHRRLGTNPFKTGFIGSTDTHLGTPGAVSETAFPGHGGAGMPASETVPPGLPDDPEFNPGALAAVWAPENSRDALFDAMRRRETYATSGPRMELRFFGGERFDPGLCEAPDLVSRAYRDGVPMGGELVPGKAARFVVAARRDPGTRLEPGTPLQRLQVIKGWVDPDGEGHEKVFDVAGDPDNGASVDLDACELRGSGFDQLCAVWEDPGYDPRIFSYYYARAVENPSCRWSQRICAARKVDCRIPSTITAGLEGCCDSAHRPVIQERAVSSPIWHTPAPAQ